MHRTDINSTLVVIRHESPEGYFKVGGCKDVDKQRTDIDTCTGH